MVATETRGYIQEEAGAAVEGATLRVDNWWMRPVVAFTLLGGFVAYASYAAFVGDNYYSDPRIIF